MSEIKTNGLLGLLGALIVLLVIFLPFSLVWAINTLLGQSNPYNFTTWLAAVVVISICRMPNAKDS
jgi:hypothetical protein